MALYSTHNAPHDSNKHGWKHICCTGSIRLPLTTDGFIRPEYGLMGNESVMGRTVVLRLLTKCHTHCCSVQV